MSFIITPYYMCAHRNSDSLHNAAFIGYSLVALVMADEHLIVVLHLHAHAGKTAAMFRAGAGVASGVWRCFILRSAATTTNKDMSTAVGKLKGKVAIVTASTAG